MIRQAGARPARRLHAVPDARDGPPDARHSQPDARHSQPDARHSPPDARDGPPDARDGAPGTRHRRSHAGAGPPDERDAGRPPEPDADPREVARTICLRMLTARPCTRAELATELRRRRVPDDAAAAVLERLDEVGLVDDAAFAASWVDRQVRTRGLSRRALATELRRKGVGAEAAAEAVAVVTDDDERARAAELVARKLPSVRGLDRPKQVNRLVGMLARKGYGGEVAYAVVRAALGGLDDED